MKNILPGDEVVSNVKILAFAGSTRNGSVNQQLCDVAADEAENAGALVTRLKLADYPLPIFSQDLEQIIGVKS